MSNILSYQFTVNKISVDIRIIQSCSLVKVISLLEDKPRSFYHRFYDLTLTGDSSIFRMVTVMITNPIAEAVY